MPIVIFIGKVIASAIGKNNPGFAFGIEILMAAGTAMYEALAARIENIKRLETSLVTIRLNIATILPFKIGIIIANNTGNHPNEKNDCNFLPLVMPISSRKMAKNPLNRSLVNGLIPSACLALARYPITKLPNIKITLLFVKECFIAEDFLIFSF